MFFSALKNLNFLQFSNIGLSVSATEARQEEEALHRPQVLELFRAGPPVTARPARRRLNCPTASAPAHQGGWRRPGRTGEEARGAA